MLELDYLLVGYGIIASGAGEAHLLNVCVREEFRSRGFGRALLAAPAAAAAAAGAEVVFLEVRPANTGRDPPVPGAWVSARSGLRPGYYQAAGGREDALVMRRTARRR